MRFGTLFTGHVKTQDRQCVETKVFSFIIPVYIMNSILVTAIVGRGRQGLEIKTNKISVIASLLRVLATASFFFFTAAYIGNFGTKRWEWLIFPAVTSFILSIFFWFFFGKTTKKEKFIRDQFFKKTEYYLMPSWLKTKNLTHYFYKLKKEYKGKFKNESWADKLRDLSKNNPEFPLCFCLTALDAELNKNDELEIQINDIVKKNM